MNIEELIIRLKISKSVSGLMRLVNNNLDLRLIIENRTNYLNGIKQMIIKGYNKRV